MKEFSTGVWNSSHDVAERELSAPVPSQAQLASRVDALSRPIHVLFLIDHLMARGGGESNLLQVVQRMPPEIVRCSVATFRIKPEIRRLFPVPVHVLPLRRVYDFQALRSGLQLRRLIRKEKVDIVQTYFETSNLWGGLIAKLSGAILVSSRRDLGILRAAKHHLAYRFVNRITDRVVAVSEEVRRFCINQDRLSPEHVSVIYNGVDFNQVTAAKMEDSPLAGADWARSGRIVTCVANIRRVKGIDVLVHAAKKVCSEMPDATFVILGDCSPWPYVIEIRSLVRSLGLEQNFQFLNFVENPLPTLKMSSAFCLLSRSEGFSNALLEAMACGVPPVVTQVGGNPEAIRDGENGFLVPVEDPNIAADRLLELLRDPARARRMGALAQSTVQARFSANTMIQQLIDLYRELVANKRTWSFLDSNRKSD
jgi:glycosyltransferase involved in cell wall biosynthesis